ncbi:BZ3500_MvSof-1268-A1-R1_Chr6-2g08455 [Microbotryum saponariae]|uniref:asparaginase n=1 Tax=Microbotryum saponariae TaxID=289078 RepID=A0A2X0L305_9BASI|nr:BZ3500_MvSof-1268-A1-R1_Chr6-2g08455 [Microbotryum saponariae]SDA07732.1 BZ3501_MvSof-1269-A2-R1_Chr6-1g08169 [Microbotryum saponariae]
MNEKQVLISDICRIAPTNRYGFDSARLDIAIRRGRGTWTQWRVRMRHECSYCTQGGTIGMLKTKEGGYAPHAGFLASNLRSQARFHDPHQDSVFANSQSVSAYSSWLSTNGSKPPSGSSSPRLPGISAPGEHDLLATMTVHTPEGPLNLPSLVTPRTAQGKRIRYAIYEYQKLIDSSEVELSDYIRMAGDIEANYKMFDAFVILHGTDTMSYSASALSFLLEDLGKTVILTGAQIPLSELFTDAIDNLLGSLIIAGHYRIPEVCVFFDNHLLRGNRSVKASSEEFGAFESANLAPLASVGTGIDVVWNEVLRPGLRPFRAHKSLSANVATLRIFPGITGKAIRAFLGPEIKGVVLESYGAGNAPRREDLLSAFREAADRGVVIVNVSQCAIGSVSEIYETGRALVAVGIAGGADMTVECALAKLAYLLSKPDLTPAQVRKLMGHSLRGELTVQSPAPTYSSPVPAGDRLRTLFSRVLDCSVPAKGVTTSPSTKSHLTLHSTADDPLPEDLDRPWPANLRDAEAAEKAILPYLLGQAAARPNSLLDQLISSLDYDASSSEKDRKEVPVPGAAVAVSPTKVIALLNEPSTPILQTPLHIAVIAGQAHNVDLLLASGASVHLRDQLSHSALFYAARATASETTNDSNLLRIVESLRNAGAHLGEVEIERGDVGVEIARAWKRDDGIARKLWERAADAQELQRAEAALRKFVE